MTTMSKSDTLLPRTLEQFDIDLKSAIKEARPVNKSYADVAVLMLHWSRYNEGSSNPDLCSVISLREVFSDTYNFKCYHRHLYVYESCDGAILWTKVLQTLTTIRNRMPENSLLIVYYSGAAEASEQGNLHLKPPKEDGEHLVLDFSRITRHASDLDRTQDILYILDTCFPCGSLLSSNKEVLASSAAASLESPDKDHKQGFTHRLASILKASVAAPKSVMDIHRDLLDKLLSSWRLTPTASNEIPIYHGLRSQHRRSLLIAPLEKIKLEDVDFLSLLEEREEGEGTEKTEKAEEIAYTKPTQKVLVTVSLISSTQEVATKRVSSLISGMPAHIKRTDVKVCACYKAMQIDTWVFMLVMLESIYKALAKRSDGYRLVASINE